MDILTNRQTSVPLFLPGYTFLDVMRSKMDYPQQAAGYRNLGPRRLVASSGEFNLQRLNSRFARSNLSMQKDRSGKIPVDDFAFGQSPFQQLDQNQTGEIISFFGISGILKGALADGRYEFSQGSVDPVIATVCFHVDYPFTK